MWPIVPTSIRWHVDGKRSAHAHIGTRQRLAGRSPCELEVVFSEGLQSTEGRHTHTHTLALFKLQYQQSDRSWVSGSGGTILLMQVLCDLLVILEFLFHNPARLSHFFLQLNYEKWTDLFRMIFFQFLVGGNKLFWDFGEMLLRVMVFPVMRRCSAGWVCFVMLIHSRRKPS